MKSTSKLNDVAASMGFMNKTFGRTDRAFEAIQEAIKAYHEALTQDLTYIADECNANELEALRKAGNDALK